MKVSENGIDLIKFFEDCRLKAYRDSGGVLTIGYGHTKNVKPGDEITKFIASELLKKDLKDAEERVNKNLKVLALEVKQFEYDSLVSLAYNLRSFEMLISHLQMNRDKFKEKMLLYCKDVKGNFLKGLKIRRIAERLHFEDRKWKWRAKGMQQMSLHEIKVMEENLFAKVIPEGEIPEPHRPEI